MDGKKYQLYAKNKVTTNTDTSHPYKGILGLDRMPGILKFLNFAVTIAISTYLTVDFAGNEIWGQYRDTTYQLNPPNWPVLPLFLWAASGVIAWLRLTGLKWKISIWGGILTCLFSVTAIGIFIFLGWLSMLIGGS